MLSRSCCAGRSQEQKKASLDALHADKAAICGYLPHDTWLVLARLEDLQSSIYDQHSLVSPSLFTGTAWCFPDRLFSCSSVLVILRLRQMEA